MNRNEVIAAYQAQIVETFNRTRSATTLSADQFADWFWTSIASQYTGAVIKALLSHLGVEKPAMTSARQFEQFHQAVLRTA